MSKTRITTQMTGVNNDNLDSARGLNTMAIPNSNSKMTQNMVMMQAESPLDQAMLPPSRP